MIRDFHSGSEISLPPRRRRRAVPNWSRHPAPPAHKSISQLLEEVEWAARLATLHPTMANRLADRAACDALAEARRKAAAEFGSPYAWRPGKWFNLEDLCGRRSRRRFLGVQEPHEMFDHPWFFRWAKGGANEGRPAAIVAQPYSAGFDLVRAEALAAENELTVHVADLFESWWSPALCTIVVWKRGSPEEAGAPWSPGPWARR